MLQTVNSKTMLTSDVYDFLKKTAQIYLPALGTLYFAIAQIWGLAGGEKVVGTIMALDAFLGVCLGISAKNYESSGAAYDGNAVVTEKPDGTHNVSLELNDESPGLVAGQSISFLVVPKVEEVPQSPQPPQPPVPPTA